MRENRLLEVRYQDSAQGIMLTGYADTVISEPQYRLVGIRFGGYPEMVQGMSAPICGGAHGHRIRRRTNVCADCRARTVSEAAGRYGFCASAPYYLEDDFLQLRNLCKGNAFAAMEAARAYQQAVQADMRDTVLERE